MTSVEETLPDDKENDPVNDEVSPPVQVNEEIQIENNEVGTRGATEPQRGSSTEEVKNEAVDIEETPTEFCEEAKEKTRVQKLFECPKCKKMLTKKTLMYYHECTKNDAPKAKRRPKKIVVQDIAEEEGEKPEKVEMTRQTNQIVEQGEKFLNSISLTNDVEQNPPSYEDLRRERLQQRIQQRNVKIQQLFQSAI